MVVNIKEINVVLTGVGGQGQLFLSRLIAETFLRYGTPALIAETHGLSQRGGSVVVHIRIGSEVKAPLIPRGRADVMLAMELIEAARYVDYLIEGGIAIVNEKMIRPAGQDVRLTEEELLDYLRNKPIRLLLVKSSKAAAELGAPQSANVHVFGCFIGLLEAIGLLDPSVDSIIESLLPKRMLSQNMDLYRLGKDGIKTLLSSEEALEIRKLLLSRS